MHLGDGSTQFEGGLDKGIYCINGRTGEGGQ